VTTLQLLRPDSAASRKAVRNLAATITPSSELEGQLVSLLNDLADGGSFLVVKDEGEVTPAEAAAMLGVTRQYVDRLLADGVLSCQRLPSSSHRRILVADVVALKRKQERKRSGREKIAELLGED
jgi:excisionase family DNA binding protein